MSDNTDIDEFPIYLAPTHGLNSDEFEAAAIYLEEIGGAEAKERQRQTTIDQYIYPFAEVAKSIGHWVFLKTQLENLHRVLAESMSSTDKNSDMVLRMSGVNAAFRSVHSQILDIYLNVFQVQLELRRDEEGEAAATNAALDLVKNQNNGALPIPEVQLELDFDSVA